MQTQGIALLQHTVVDPHRLGQLYTIDRQIPFAIRQGDRHTGGRLNKSDRLVVRQTGHRRYPALKAVDLDGFGCAVVQVQVQFSVRSSQVSPVERRPERIATRVVDGFTVAGHPGSDTLEDRLGFRGQAAVAHRTDVDQKVRAAGCAARDHVDDLAGLFPVVVGFLVAPGVIERDQALLGYVHGNGRDLVIAQIVIVGDDVADARIDQAVGLDRFDERIQLMALLRRDVMRVVKPH